jgi:hypothetical protein
MAMFSFVWSWIIGHSWKQLAWAGAVFGLILLTLYFIHHERQIGRDETKAQIAVMQSNLDKANDANASCAATIPRLQMSVSQCETGRLADVTAIASAQASREADRVKLERTATDAKTKLAALLADRCKAWAAEPACGAQP